MLDGSVQIQLALFNELQGSQGCEGFGDRAEIELSLGRDRLPRGGFAVAFGENYPVALNNGDGQARQAVGFHLRLDERIHGF